MSYCNGGNDARAWLSSRNWNRVMENLLLFDRQNRAARAAATPAARAAQAPGPPTAVVIGIATATDARVLSVLPAAPGNARVGAVPGSPFVVVASGADGRVLAEVGAEVKTGSDGGGSTFRASVPAETAAVEVRRPSGQTLHRVARSNAPTVRLRGVRVTRAGALDVRWRAADPDGDALEAAIDVAPSGSSWRTVLQGPSRGRAVIPRARLQTGRRSRVRVRVTDGFAGANAVSRTVRIRGRGPAAQISVPADGAELTAGEAILQGSARDDRGRRLRDRALTWYAGARRLGRGERVPRAALPAGRVVLRLVARDRNGRRSTARRVLRIAPTTLVLRTFAAPDRVGRRARTVRVLVATNIPAHLHAGRRSYAVGPRRRVLRLRLPSTPAKGVVRLSARVTSDGPRQPAIRATAVTVRG